MKSCISYRVKYLFGGVDASYSSAVQNANGEKPVRVNFANKFAWVQEDGRWRAAQVAEGSNFEERSGVIANLAFCNASIIGCSKRANSAKDWLLNPSGLT